MRTSIEIDEKLMKKAMKATGATSMRVAVDRALRALLLDEQRRQNLLAMQGKIKFIPGYDPRATRA